MPGESLLTIEDYGRLCRQTLPRPLFDVIFGTEDAAEFETLRNNLEGFKKLVLRPRVLTGSARPALAVSVLEEQVALPVLIAPSGSNQRFDPEGERAVARAAGQMGTIMTVSTASNYSLEEIAAAATGPVWFQLYFFKDRELNSILIHRAETAGYKAIVVTVDVVTGSSKERHGRHDLTFAGIHYQRYNVDPSRIMRNFVDLQRPGVPTLETFQSCLESVLGWSDIDWLRRTTSLPLIVKGIQTAEDAALCVEHGADAVIVSNHGGHALNGARASIEALPEVVDAVGDKIEVYVDGGFRKGTDVLKALALGARAVLVGRPVLWGLTLGGQNGVQAVLELLRNELLVAGGQSGVMDVRTVDRNLLATAGHFAFAQAHAPEPLLA
jgi:4-hydroxymandelate oxidase